MAGIPRAPKLRGRTRILIALRVVAVSRGRRARITHEEVVERTILLNDEDDVLDGPLRLSLGDALGDERVRRVTLSVSKGEGRRTGRHCERGEQRKQSLTHPESFRVPNRSPRREPAASRWTFTDDEAAIRRCGIPVRARFFGRHDRGLPGSYRHRCPTCRAAPRCACSTKRRGFDNLFQGYPGADTVPSGENSRDEPSCPRRRKDRYDSNDYRRAPIARPEG